MRIDGQNQLKISAPNPMTETYRLISLLAALISLDSPAVRGHSKISAHTLPHRWKIQKKKRRKTGEM
jgi:hypothetical protein